MTDLEVNRRGGITFGIGMALLEETHVDRNIGRVTNANIAEYLVPVHADVPEITTIFVEEQDRVVNPAGVKGLGELPIVGAAAAVANAVYHATGVRVRDLPIRLEKLLT
jgi:xanthine dehydrogenase YagR molybdenum-binding subunit